MMHALADGAVAAHDHDGGRAGGFACSRGWARSRYGPARGGAPCCHPPPPRIFGYGLAPRRRRNRLLVRDGGAACAGGTSVTRLYQEVFNPPIPCLTNELLTGRSGL